MFNLFEGDIRTRLKESYAKPTEFFCCNPIWPMCAFNFAKKHVIPEEFTFKSENYENIPIIMDFYSEQRLSGEVQDLQESQRITHSSCILIERNYHYCLVNLFVNTFASLYVNKKKQDRLFRCKHLAIKKNMTQIESHKKMMKFVSYIKEQHLHSRERIKAEPLKVIYENKGAAAQ